MGLRPYSDTARAPAIVACESAWWFVVIVSAPVVVDAVLNAKQVSPRTTWWTVVVKTSTNDIFGIGEVSDAELFGDLRSIFIQAKTLVTGRTLEEARAALGRWWRAQDPGPPRLLRSTVAGGVEMALWDAEGRILGEPVWRLLGSATPPESVRAYANINRACIDRTPEAFAELAIRAIRDGFVTVKLAPFDNSTADEGRRSIEAVRAAVGDGIEILVDCHHRLTAEQLSDLMPSLEATNVGWLEDIPSEVQTRLPIAGGELFTTEEEIAAADLDWFLPDVKHAGGIAPSLALVKAALRRGCRIAPHNPTGPVATAASLQLAALFESDVVLEFQYGETAARPSPEFGRLPIPRGPGLGLDSAAFE